MQNTLGVKSWVVKKVLDLATQCVEIWNPLARLLRACTTALKTDHAHRDSHCTPQVLLTIYLVLSSMHAVIL